MAQARVVKKETESVLGDYAFNRYDIVALRNERPGVRLGSHGQVLGCYRRPSETTWVVAFGDAVFEDLHGEDLSFVRSEARRVHKSPGKPWRVVIPASMGH